MRHCKPSIEINRGAIVLHGSAGIARMFAAERHQVVRPGIHVIAGQNLPAHRLGGFEITTNSQQARPQKLDVRVPIRRRQAAKHVECFSVFLLTKQLESESEFYRRGSCLWRERVDSISGCAGQTVDPIRSATDCIHPGNVGEVHGGRSRLKSRHFRKGGRRRTAFLSHLVIERVVGVP